MKKGTKLEVKSIQYVYSKEFEKKWKSYYLNLIDCKINELIEGGFINEEEHYVSQEIIR